MKTVYLLMAQFETPLIPLKDISATYFGCSPATAARKASAGTLPVPVMRLGESQKASLVVHINDLAAFIDQQAEHARKEWQAVNN